MKETQLAGITLMVLATFVFALQDAITKTLTAELPVSQILFVRFSAFALMALYVAHRQIGLRAAFASVVPGLQISRCLLMCAEIALFAYVLRFLGLAQMHALFACFPLFVAALSVPVLGERVGWRRWLAVIIGFAGTFIILRPGTAVFNPLALLPLLGAALYAVYNLLTRKVSKKDAYATSLVYFGVVGALASGVFAIGQWQEISTSAAFKLTLLSVVSVVAHMMLMKALQLTEAVVLQPFQYFILPWALLLGYFLFGETLDVWSLLGSIIVVGSGVYVAFREYHQQRRYFEKVPSSP